MSQVVRGFYSGYGDLTRLQVALMAEGNAALHAYSRLDRIIRCYVVASSAAAGGGASGSGARDGAEQEERPMMVDEHGRLVAVPQDDDEL